jgi:hypothetical protein
MITITFSNNRTTHTVTIADVHAPALRSAIDEIRNEIGGRLEGNFEFAKEEALTAASIALAALAGGINAVVAEGDEHYA